MANYQLEQTGAEVQALLNAVESPDTTPAAGSSNLITSGAVQAAVAGVSAEVTALGHEVNKKLVSYITPTWTSGYINASNGNYGSTSASGYYATSDYYDVSYMRRLVLWLPGPAVSYSLVCFYDQDKVKISSVESNDSQITTLHYVDVPSGALYARFGARTTDATEWAKANVGFVADSTKMVGDINNLTTISEKTAGNTIYNKLYGKFIRGSLTAGAWIDKKNRVCSNDIMYYSFPMKLDAATGFRFGIHIFVGGVFSTDSGWQTSYTLPAGTYFKIVIARATEDSQEIADISTFVSAITLNGGDSVLDIIYDELEGIKAADSFLGMDIPKTFVNANYGNQGLTKVGNYYIHFVASAADHSVYADIRRFDSSFQHIADMTHNFGHAASADYCEDSDTIVIGNGSNDLTNLPQIDLVTSALAKVTAGGQLSYSGADVIHIPLFTANKQIGGAGAICTFGGNWRIVYVITGIGTQPRKIFKCLLGAGTEDLSDHSVGGTDATKWGTFISGKSDDEYNGTLEVISVHEGEDMGVYQGCCYRNGCIYILTGDNDANIKKVRLIANSYKVVQTNQPNEYNADGTIKTCHPEGLCFVDKDTMLLGIPAYGGLFTVESF